VSSTRRHLRVLYGGPVRLAWDDDRGEPRYTIAKCLDVSEAGLRIEAPVSIPLRTYVTLRAERINVCGTAAVKNVARAGSKFILGLELSAQLKGVALEKLTEPALVNETVPQPVD